MCLQGRGAASLLLGSWTRSQCSTEDEACKPQGVAVCDSKDLPASFLRVAQAAFTWGWVNDAVNDLDSLLELLSQHRTCLPSWWILSYPLSSYTVKDRSCLYLTHAPCDKGRFRDRHGRPWRWALKAPLPFWLRQTAFMRALLHQLSLSSCILWIMCEKRHQKRGGMRTTFKARSYTAEDEMVGWHHGLNRHESE